eukprot:m.258582 g.258582  ORF g.258582 m.258582 type:complete len:121 (-) comp21685_c0_seq1:114-476(-)
MLYEQKVADPSATAGEVYYSLATGVLVGGRDRAATVFERPYATMQRRSSITEQPELISDRRASVGTGSRDRGHSASEQAAAVEEALYASADIVALAQPRALYLNHDASGYLDVGLYDSTG